MGMLKKIVFGFLLGLTGHIFGLKIINTWKTTPDSWVSIFKYAIGMSLIVPTYIIVKYGWRSGKDVEEDIKNQVLSWVIVGSGVVSGYVLDQFQFKEVYAHQITFG